MDRHGGRAWDGRARDGRGRDGRARGGKVPGGRVWDGTGQDGRERDDEARGRAPHGRDQRDGRAPGDTDPRGRDGEEHRALLHGEEEGGQGAGGARGAGRSDRHVPRPQLRGEAGHRGEEQGDADLKGENLILLRGATKMLFY